VECKAEAKAAKARITAKHKRFKESVQMVAEEKAQQKKAAVKKAMVLEMLEMRLPGQSKPLVHHPLRVAQTMVVEDISSSSTEEHLSTSSSSEDEHGVGLSGRDCLTKQGMPSDFDCAAAIVKEQLGWGCVVSAGDVVYAWRLQRAALESTVSAKDLEVCYAQAVFDRRLQELRSRGVTSSCTFASPN
jgi:hypothetical protein